MKFDSYNRFLKSDVYHSFLEAKTEEPLVNKVSDYNYDGFYLRFWFYHFCLNSFFSFGGEKWVLS